jgi:hypothetical protein
MILPYDANPGRMEFSERTGSACPSLTDFRVFNKREEWVPVLGASNMVHSLSRLHNWAFCLFVCVPKTSSALIN